MICDQVLQVRNEHTVPACSGCVPEAANKVIEKQAVDDSQRNRHHQRGRHQFRPVKYVTTNQLGRYAGADVPRRRLGNERRRIDVIAQ